MTTHRSLIAAAVLAAASVGALAQNTPAPAGAGPRGEMMMGGPRGDMMMAHRGPMNMEDRQARMEHRVSRHLNALKLKLQLTPAQEGAWTAFTAAMKPPAFQRPAFAEMAKLTTPERIDRMRAMRTQRAAEMDKRADAAKTFYGALSADQKKVFDDETLHMMAGGRRGPGQGGGHGHG